MDLSMPKLAVGFQSLPLEYQNVIRLAQEMHHIAVTPLQALTGGYSGAIIYLVSVALFDPGRVEHYILKLDRKSEKTRSDEFGRYQNAIRLSPPDFAERHIARMAFERVEQAGAVAIFYSIAGQSLNQYRTLSAYERQSQVERIFADTHPLLLCQWNANRSFSQAVHPQGILEQWLGFRLKPGNQIDDFLRTFCRVQPDLPGFLLQGSVFPNPMAYAKDPNLWANTRPLDVLTGLQHGDLNTNNILVKFSRTNDSLDGYFLIDLAMFKEGMPLLYDLRYLEMSYLVLRQAQISQEKSLDLIAHLGQADRLDPQEIPVDAAGIGGVISSTRDVFGAWVEQNHPSLHDDLWGQYWLAGVAAGLSYCHKAALPVEDRLAGLVYAAANLKRFSALFGLPTPSEGQAIYSPAGLMLERTSRPSIRTDSGRSRNNLPIQTTPFVGRQAQVAAARDLILSDSVRLITFTGPGGAGKTRLSIQVACGLWRKQPT
jgi:hypothetical protein